MSKRGGRARLALETLPPLRIGRELRRQDLDRDVALQPLVSRPVDLSHASRSEGAKIS